MPKLGWIDQLLYWTAMLLTGGGAFFLLLFPTYYRSELADANPLTLSWCDGEGVLHMLWLVFWLFLACILIASVFYPSRRPIVGRRDIRYGPPAYPRIYPLFMKVKQEWRSKKAIAADARGRRVIITTLIVSFLFCAALYPCPSLADLNCAATERLLPTTPITGRTPTTPFAILNLYVCVPPRREAVVMARRLGMPSYHFNFPMGRPVVFPFAVLQKPGQSLFASPKN